MKKIQQGDILFVKIDNIPDEAKPIKPNKGRYVLAEGEATGHTHAVKVAPKLKVLKDKDGLYMKVDSKAPVVHEEHDTKEITKGDWWITRVNEWNYDKKRAEKNRD